MAIIIAVGMIIKWVIVARWRIVDGWRQWSVIGWRRIRWRGIRSCAQTRQCPNNSTNGGTSTRVTGDCPSDCTQGRTRDSTRHRIRMKAVRHRAIGRCVRRASCKHSRDPQDGESDEVPHSGDSSRYGREPRMFRRDRMPLPNGYWCSMLRSGAKAAHLGPSAP